MNRYAVVQEKFQTIDPDVLRAVLVEQAGMVTADATRIAHKLRGVLTDRLSLKQASAVRQALQFRGYAVRVIPAEKMIPEQKAKIVRWFEMDEQRIRLPLGYHGDCHDVPWRNVFVISAGRVSEIKERETEMVEYHPFRHGRVTVERKVQRQSESMYVTELICVAESGTFVHVRFPSREMNYKRVLGGELNASLFEKYLAMLDALVARSTSALVSPETTRLLMERKEERETIDGDLTYYQEEKEFADYNRWLLQLVLWAEGFADSQS